MYVCTSRSFIQSTIDNDGSRRWREDVASDRGRSIAGHQQSAGFGWDLCPSGVTQLPFLDPSVELNQCRKASFDSTMRTENVYTCLLDM